MVQDHTLTLNRELYKIQINQITIQQIAQPVPVIQINHLLAAAIQQKHLRVAVIQRVHQHAAALTALLRAILEVHDHHHPALTPLQVVAVTAVEVLQVRAVAVAVLVVQEAVQVVVHHQVAAEDN
jgi:hypothetical protein